MNYCLGTRNIELNFMNKHLCSYSTWEETEEIRVCWYSDHGAMA